MISHITETLIFLAAVIVVVVVLFLIPICGVSKRKTIEIVKHIKKMKK